MIIVTSSIPHRSEIFGAPPEIRGDEVGLAGFTGRP